MYKGQVTGTKIAKAVKAARKGSKGLGKGLKISSLGKKGSKKSPFNGFKI